MKIRKKIQLHIILTIDMHVCIKREYKEKESERDNNIIYEIIIMIKETS